MSSEIPDNKFANLQKDFEVYVAASMTPEQVEKCSQIFELVCKEKQLDPIMQELKKIYNGLDQVESAIQLGAEVDLHQALNLLRPFLMLVQFVDKKGDKAKINDKFQEGAFSGIQLLVMSLDIKEKQETISIEKLKKYLEYFGKSNMVQINFVSNLDIESTIMDRDLFSHIVELCINAVKYSKPKKITVEYKIQEHNQIITVANDGNPIDENILDQIFEEGVTTSEFGGGNGLYFIQKYLQEKGGKIIAENLVEGGVIFRIELPSRNS